jgi:hypothetical protein
LETGIRDYIKYCEEEGKHMGMAGMAFFLGCNRMTLFRYAKGEYGKEYCDPIKAGLAAIESYQENRLLDGVATAGTIFSLKNNFENWRDQQHVDHSGDLKIGKVTRKIVHEEPEAIEGTAKRVNGSG